MPRGIDYTPIGSTVNRDPQTGIRYGVIPMSSLGEFVPNSFDPIYDASCPHCGVSWPDGMDTPITCSDCGEHVRDGEEYGDEPCGLKCSDDAYVAHADSGGDVWFERSPYYTRAAFCSPCAPGACYLLNACDDGERAYCPGPDWFDAPPPFPIYRVDNNELVASDGGGS